jgi:signal peptidase I
MSDELSTGGGMPASLPYPRLGGSPRVNFTGRLLMATAIVVGLGMLSLIVLRVLGLIRPFFVPTGAMAPTVAARDHVFMEKLSFLLRKPRRGDILVFSAEGLPLLPPHTLVIKRLVGCPGDTLRLSEGYLYVNGRELLLSNSAGRITYVAFPNAAYLDSPSNQITVPPDHCFMLGDNSSNSLDSRFWGFLPADNIQGRLVFCYWPPNRIGTIK